MTEDELVQWLRERIAEDDPGSGPLPLVWLGGRWRGFTVPRVRAECASKLALIEKITARRHRVVEGDCWFTCAVATEERDGGSTCDDNRMDGPCDCGRDKTVRELLELLAAPYRIGGGQ